MQTIRNTIPVPFHCQSKIGRKQERWEGAKEVISSAFRLSVSDAISPIEAETIATSLKSFAEQNFI